METRPFFGYVSTLWFYKVLYISTLRYSTVAASRRGVADLAEHLLNVSPNVDKIMRFGETFGWFLNKKENPDIEYMIILHNFVVSMGLHGYTYKDVTWRCLLSSNFANLNHREDTATGRSHSVNIKEMRNCVSSLFISARRGLLRCLSSMVGSEGLS